MPIKAAIPALPTPSDFAALAVSDFQSSKPAEVLEQGAACTVEAKVMDKSNAAKDLVSTMSTLKLMFRAQ